MRNADTKSPNPYESRPIGDEPSAPQVRPQLPAGCAVAAVGFRLTLPLVLFLLQHWLTPVFVDVGLQLPPPTEYLSHTAAVVLLAIASVGVFIAVSGTAGGRMGRLSVWIAVVTGVLVIGLFLLAFLVPLLSLWRSLG